MQNTTYLEYIIKSPHAHPCHTILVINASYLRRVHLPMCMSLIHLVVSGSSIAHLDVCFHATIPHRMHVLHLDTRPTTINSPSNLTKNTSSLTMHACNMVKTFIYLDLPNLKIMSGRDKFFPELVDIIYKLKAIHCSWLDSHLEGAYASPILVTTGAPADL